MRTSSQCLSLADLPAVFEDPLSEVTSLPLRTNADAQKEIENLKSKLQPKTDWSAKCDAIQRTMQLLKGGALAFPDFEFAALAPGIADSITDLRSTLVKWSALCVAAASRLLGSKFSSHVDLFIPAFFKQTTHGTAVISQCCRLGILQVVANANSRRTIQAVLAKSDSKSSVHRAILAESLAMIRDRWPPVSYQSSLAEIKKVLAGLRSDKSQEVREIARQIGEFETAKRTPSPRKKSESKYGTVRESAPTRAVMQFASMTLKRSSAKRTEIAPPRTASDAAVMLDQLVQLLNSGEFKKGKMGKEICEALPAALSLLPNHEKWNLVIPRLFELLTSELSSQVPSIIEKLEFSEVIIGSAISVYGFRELLGRFDEERDAIQFAAVVIMKFPGVEIGESELKYLKKLCERERDAPGIEIVRGICEDVKEKLTHVLKDIAQKLFEDEPLGDCFTEIETAKTDDFAADVQKVSERFAELLQSPLHGVVSRTLGFLEKFLDYYSFITIDSLILPLIEITKDSTSIFPPMAERCLIPLFKNTDLKTTICPLIATDSDEVMCLIQRFLETLTSTEIERYKDFLPLSILPVFESDSVTVRRAAVMSFAKFSTALGYNFDKYIRKLTQTNQILVQRFASRTAL